MIKQKWSFLGAATLLLGVAAPCAAGTFVEEEFRIPFFI
jgi:hypothetical protein